MYKKIVTFCFLIVFICLTAAGCKNYVGIEWVTDYSAVGKSNVSGRQGCAEGFYNEIIALSDWEGRFNHGNANAWEEHFKTASMGGTDESWIDNVDFAFFAGHGAGAGFVPTGVGRGGGFTFGVNAHDDWVLSAIPTNREPKWGDNRLEWIVLDVCSALALSSDGTDVLYTLGERWANSEVMDKLHFILGFRTLAHDSSTRGQLFARYLTGAIDGTNYTIRDAWRKATEDTEGGSVEGAYLRAWSPGASTFNDHLYGFGSVSKDPDPATQSYQHYSWSCLW